MKIRSLCPELEEVVRKELNEDPKRIESDIQHIKDWIAKQPHLRARSDDQWIIAFLRGCKYSLERVKEKIDLYYTLRTTAADLWQYKYNEAKFMEIIDLGAVLILPKSQTVISPRVILIRSGCYDPNKYHISEILAVSNVIREIAMYDDDTFAIAGGIALQDLSGTTAAHVLQMTPTMRKKMILSGQASSPMRAKGTHFINTPAGFETVFNLMKGLLSEKNRSRLFVHNKNYEELYKYIPKELLPAEYGGNAGTIPELVDYWKKKIIQHSSWLEEDFNNGTDESKRPGKPKTAEDLFGVDGSFRQLEFD